MGNGPCRSLRCGKYGTRSAALNPFVPKRRSGSSHRRPLTAGNSISKCWRWRNGWATNRHRAGALAQRRPQPCKIVETISMSRRYLHRAANCCAESIGCEARVRLAANPLSEPQRAHRTDRETNRQKHQSHRIALLMRCTWGKMSAVAMARNCRRISRSRRRHLWREHAEGEEGQQRADGSGKGKNRSSLPILAFPSG